MYVSRKFTGWRAVTLTSLASNFTASPASFADDASAAAVAAAAAHDEMQGKSDKLVKAAAMPFIKFKMAEALSGGSQVRTVTAAAR